MSSQRIYVAGGAVQAGSGIYIQRSADDILYEYCLAGEYCYVLTPRQMGKTSLMINIGEKLDSKGIATVDIDLSEIGTHLTADQWYLGILREIADQLSLTTEPADWWVSNAYLGNSQRLTTFLRKVVLPEIDGQIVIFIDEIDSTLSLDFSDDFFAAIRSCYNARGTHHIFYNISFVLLGTASPNDLIQDPERTPFNLGQMVDLEEFSFEEAFPLSQGLDLPDGEAGRALKLLLEWTGGHPYLTQRLCKVFSENKPQLVNEKTVEDIVDQTFFQERAEEDNNLRFVSDMLTKRTPSNYELAVLKIYMNVLEGKSVNQEQSIPQTHLKLSGVVKVEKNKLVIRNQIYSHVFDERWVKENWPLQRRNQVRALDYLEIGRDLFVSILTLRTLVIMLVAALIIALIAIIQLGYPEPSETVWNQILQIWGQNNQAGLLSFIVTLVVGILVGIFIQHSASTLSEWTSRLIRFLLDRFAAAPLVRLRYEREYRLTLAAAVQELQGGHLVDRVIQLNQIYVPALLTEKTSLDTQYDFADRFRIQSEILRQQRRQAIRPWEAVSRFRRLIILGGPGSGKTTYLYHLAYMCAHRRRPEVQHYLPIFIRFREMVRNLEELDRLEDIFPAVLANYGFPNSERFIYTQLKRGRCLILFDGLDEIASEELVGHLIALVQEFSDRYCREKDGNIIIITSRSYQYNHGQQLRGFQKCELMGFDASSIERFIHNWFASNDKLADELFIQIKGNRRFLELARNPLLLLLIVYHYERERNLPSLRAELYRQIARTRITKWNTIRGTHRGRFGEFTKWQLLGELALHLFQHEKRGLLQHRELLDWLSTFAKTLHSLDNTSPEMLLDEVVRTSGLIQEWTNGHYGFSHQTLQELFAAEAIGRQGPDGGASLLEAHLKDPVWKEVILLYCGLADNSEPLLQRIIMLAERSDANKVLWLLAGECLAEGARGVPTPLRRKVAEAIVSLVNTTTATDHFLTMEEQREAVKNLQVFAGDLLSNGDTLGFS